jgi:hypothetical protein
VHGVPADLFRRERDRIALQDEVVPAEVDRRCVLADRGAQRDAGIGRAAISKQALEEPRR